MRSAVTVGLVFHSPMYAKHVMFCKLFFFETLSTHEMTFDGFWGVHHKLIVRALGGDLCAIHVFQWVDLHCEQMVCLAGILEVVTKVMQSKMKGTGNLHGKVVANVFVLWQGT